MTFARLLPVVAAISATAAAACGGSIASDDWTSSDAGAAHDSASPGSDAPDATLSGTGTDAAPSDAGLIDSPQPQDAATDVSTCGPCAGTCFGTRCMIVLASNEVSPTSIAVTPKRVFWTNQGSPANSYADSALRSVSIDGGGATTVASTPGGQMDCVVADESLVVWSDHGSISAAPADLSGGVGTLMTNVGASSIAMDGDGVYWTQYASGSSTVAEAWRVDRDGGHPTPLMDAGGMPEEILVHDGLVVWQAYFSGGSYATSIFTVTTRGGGARTLLSGLPSGLFPWAALGGDLYWAATMLPLEMQRVSLDGGAPVVVASNFTPGAMTADATTIYFTNDNAVYEMPTDGGAPVAVAWKLPHPFAIAVDATSIYWTDLGDCDAGVCGGGAILKLTPK